MLCIKQEEIRRSDLDAIVLAGGESKRMGVPKALLPLDGTTLIGTVVDILRPLFRRVLVVARDYQGLTQMGVEVLIDDRLERGPLVGLERGLAASNAPWCFAVGCDMPFLQVKVIRRMAEHLDGPVLSEAEGYEVLVADLGGIFQPLHAFYARRCLPYARMLLDSGTTSLQALLALCNVHAIPSDDFRDIDPDLLSFRDLDTLEDYQAARQLHGERFG